MASTEATATRGLELPPDAPKPDFRWTVSLPTTWRIIDLNPTRTDAVINNLLRDDDLVPGARLKRSHQREVKQAMVDMATQARDAGSLLALILPGISGEEVVAVTMLLRWVDSAPAAASVLDSQKQLGLPEDSTVEKTNQGDPYLLFHSQMEGGPITQRRTLYTHQAFIPAPGTSWTLVVSATAPNAETSESVEAIVRRAAASFVVVPDDAEFVFTDSDEITQADANQSSEPTSGGETTMSRVWLSKEGFTHNAE